MSEVKEWIIGGTIAVGIWFCMNQCEEKQKEEAQTDTPSYTQPSAEPNDGGWKPVIEDVVSDDDWEPVIEDPEPVYNNQRTVTYNTNSSGINTISSSNEYWEDWEDTDFKIYVELEGCESLEEAQDYDYGAIEEDGRYFIPKSISSGIYEVEIGEKVNSKMWKINHTSYFLKFKYNPWLWKWDEGVIDVFGGKGTFYKKPD